MPENRTNNTIQAFWIGLGSLCSFGFSLVSAAIISRYLTKDEYGTYRQILYVYNTLLVVFTLGLPRAYSYFLPRVDISEGQAIIRKLNICFLFLGVIFSAILYCGADLIADILKNPGLSEPMRIFSPTPIFLLPTMGLEGVLATYKRTQLNAIYTVITRFISVLFIVIPVIYYKSTCNIAVGGFTTSAVFTCLIGLIIMRYPFRGIVKKHSSVGLKEILMFSVPLMFAGIGGIAEKAADQFYISRWFGEVVFADFANGSMELPFVGMVLSAGAVVLLPLFSKLSLGEGNKEEIISLWRRSAIKAAYILYPLVVFSWFFATPIMTFLYGEQYEDSGIYFKIMLVINIFTIAQYYPILLALGKTRLYSTVLILSAIVVWGIEYISVSIFNNSYLVSVVSVAVRIGKILFFLSVISKVLRCSIKKLFPFGDLGRILFSSVVSCAITLLFL
ncbi:MAG: oligosaccharide flippase family protein, partial [Muribaculaceae bacterium]|nr:oligosaccharide flippase family protein [Muribaculaceae bacterium]